MVTVIWTVVVEVKSIAILFVVLTVTMVTRALTKTAVVRAFLAVVVCPMVAMTILQVVTTLFLITPVRIL